MINIKSYNNEFIKFEWFKNNKLYTKNYPKMVIVPHSIKRNKISKKMYDVYSNKNYYIELEPYDYDTPNITIPFKINTNKEGVPYYDWQLASKLLYFNEIIDNGISFPNYLYYDIETTSLDPKDGIITSIVFIDKNNNIKTFINEDGNEMNMLQNVTDFLLKNNIMSLIGFNSKKFDDEYLRYRMNINQIKYNPIMNCNIDIMQMCNKLFINGSLASIAKQLGVIEKIELENNPIKLFYNGDFDTLIEYNIRDVEVTKAIAEKMNILPFVQALWELSWCDFRNLNANSRLNDCYFNKRMWEDNKMLSYVDLKYKGKFGGGFNYFKED